MVLNAGTKKLIKDVILREDFEYIADKVFSNGDFSNATVMVTGATGLVGSLLVKSILYANQNLNSNITVIACVRSIEKAKKIFSDFLNDANLSLITKNLFEPVQFERQIDYIIHTASITASKEMVNNPTGVLLTAFESTRNLLNYIKKHQETRMVYISSMEYYGQIAEDNADVTEEKLGYIDIREPRSSYPESKRVCESLCNAYASQFGVNVCSARLAQTFGAGVPVDDTRVFAQFARSALNSTNIVLHTTGESEGNYCYTADAIYGVFLLLLKGEKGQSYNVAKNHSSIINMAKMVAEKIAQNKIQVKVKIPENLNDYGYAPDVKLKLNSNKLRALGWEPSQNLEQMFVRMCESWRYQQ